MEQTNRRGPRRALLMLLSLWAATLPAVPVHAQAVDGDMNVTAFNNLLGPNPGVDPSAVNLDYACGKTMGCIVVANNSDDYDITRIDVDAHARADRHTRWTNILEDSHWIAPRKIFLIPRIGGDKLAVVGLRVTMRHQTTHKKEQIEIGTIDLRPDVANQLYVNFLRFDPKAAKPVVATQIPAGS